MLKGIEYIKESIPVTVYGNRQCGLRMGTKVLIRKGNDWIQVSEPSLDVPAGLLEKMVIGSDPQWAGHDYPWEILKWVKARLAECH